MIPRHLWLAVPFHELVRYANPRSVVREHTLVVGRGLLPLVSGRGCVGAEFGCGSDL